MLAKADALELIKAKKADAVVSDVLLERIPFIFSESWEAFREWRLRLSELIDVDPCDIFFTGSSAVGFSLNPNKGFRDFDDGSDIDLAVISPHHFDIAWRFIRAQRRSKIDQRLWDSILEHKSKYIYWGCIASDRILPYLPFGAAWLSALTIMAAEGITRDRTLRLRIYRDVASLRSYQASNIQSLKASI
jgi:hypothetical protein